MSKLKNERFFVPLNLKITLIILLGISFGVLTVVAGTAIEDRIAYKYYNGPAAETRIQEQAFDDLKRYIKEQHVKGTDKNLIDEWLKTKDYTSLTISDNHKTYYSSAWRVKKYFGVTKLEESTVVSPKGIEELPVERLDYNLNADIYNKIIKFDDQPYYVNIDVYKEEGLYATMSIGMVVVAFFLLLITVFIYNSRVIKRIIKISDDVTAVSSGDIDRVITVSGNDEIGKMGHGIERMRITLIKKLASEKEAWESNRELITSMSHDIRTPLTSMIGYLDIIEGEKYSSKEEMESYISACRDKAFQLKNLSDKLFQYFLVYGKSKQNIEWEVLDGDILFQQLLTEHTAELISYGLFVRLDYTIPQVLVRTEVDALRRLFDNLFSNIMKYAHKKSAVDINAKLSGDMIEITLENEISTEARMVESTCIGVKTCEKLVGDLGGFFYGGEEGDKYVTHIRMPIYYEDKLDDDEVSEILGISPIDDIE